MDSGNGGLAMVFSKASTTLGWINPFKEVFAISWRNPFKAAPAAQSTEPDEVADLLATREKGKPPPTYSQMRAAMSARSARQQGEPSSESTFSPSMRQGLPSASTPQTQRPPLLFSTMHHRAPSSPSPSPPRAAALSPPRAQSPLATSAMSARSVAMKATQLQAQQANQASGNEARRQGRALKELHESEKARFLSAQHEKIRAQHQQLADTAKSVKTMTATKTSNNNHQRTSYARTWYRELKKERAYAEKGRERVISERTMTHAKRTARKELMQQKNNAAAMKAKSERMERRAHEHDKEKKQEMARKQNTARVRNETRPEVRKDGRDFFQNQRDAMGDEERANNDESREAIARWKSDFLRDHVPLRNESQRVDEGAKAARDKLAEVRKQEADELRSQLQDERERGRQLHLEQSTRVKGMHDQVHAHEKGSSVLFAPPWFTKAA